MHPEPRLNCFLSEAVGRNGISTIWETDNEQNKRSEEKQKTQPFPCIGEGFASVLLSCEKNGGRIFPRSPPRQVESPPLLPPFPRGCARVRPSSSRVRQKGRERATKGGKVRRETTAGRYDDDDDERGGGSCEWGRSRSILLHSSSLGLRAVVFVVLSHLPDLTLLTLISVIVRTYIFT